MSLSSPGYGLPIFKTLNSQYASIVKSAVRIPSAFAVFQTPVITNTATRTKDFNKIGAQMVMKDITSLKRTSILEAGADTCDISFLDQNGNYSPITASSGFGTFFFPGAADNKMLLFMGLEKQGAITVIPKGVFVAESYNQQQTESVNTVTLNTFDQAYLFQGNVYTQFPPRLYGNQQSSYYNPNYALTNPSGDRKTYVCDASNWMATSNQAPLWASDYVQVAVYSSAVSSGNTPVPNSGSTAYTIDYVHGTVTFTSPQGATDVISVDARPLAMAPELMMKHLFVDFGSFSPSFLKLDSTGIKLPILEVARDRQIWDVAKDIVYCTNAKGVRWNLFFDPGGYLTFSELAIDGPPVRTITDEFDLIKWAPEYTVRDVKNVVRASATSMSNQPLISVSYDLLSISNLTQKPTYEIPTQFLATVGGMDPASGLAYMNRLTSSVLFETAFPTIQASMEIAYDPSLNPGDVVTVKSWQTGVNQDFYINQIDEDLQDGGATQTCRVTQFKASQDFVGGLQQYAGAPLPQNQNQISASAGLIDSVSINGTSVVTGGNPVVDQFYNPVVAQWNGGALPISIGLKAQPSGVNSYIWRWMYIAEDVYDSAGLVTGIGPLTSPYSSQAQANGDFLSSMMPLSGSHPCPADVRTNNDSAVSRRYWWPILRCSDWLANDGVTPYNSATVLSSTWSQGVGASSVTTTVYGGLLAGVSDYDTPVSPNYVGQALFAAGTPAATALGASSTAKYGVDFGTSIVFPSAPYAGIKRKQTRCFLGILVANTSGVYQLKRIAFSLSV